MPQNPPFYLVTPTKVKFDPTWSLLEAYINLSEAYSGLAFDLYFEANERRAVWKDVRRARYLLRDTMRAAHAQT